PAVRPRVGSAFPTIWPGVGSVFPTIWAGVGSPFPTCPGHRRSSRANPEGILGLLENHLGWAGMARADLVSDSYKRSRTNRTPVQTMQTPHVTEITRLTAHPVSIAAERLEPARGAERRRPTRLTRGMTEGTKPAWSRG